MDASDQQRTGEILPGALLEYPSIRGELLQRLEMRQNLLSITLSLAGLFVSFGLANPGVSLVYSPLAVFLAMLWGQNEIRCRQIGKYIQQLEASIPGLRWESYYRDQTEQETRFGPWPLSIMAPAGIFVTTQAVAVTVGIATMTGTPVEWFLVALSALALTVTLALILHVRRTAARYRR
jgi:preprotein translocase subunit SecY